MDADTEEPEALNIRWDAIFKNFRAFIWLLRYFTVPLNEVIYKQ